jgi:chaperonin GroES
MNIRMISNRVLIRPDEPETRIGTILLADTAVAAKSLKGTVLAVGPGKTDDGGRPVPVLVNKGDRVLLREFSGQDVMVGQEKLCVVFDHEILAVVE